MSRYVDADKAKNGIMKFVNEYGEIVGMFVNDFNILLERCAVDAQEVVRCRECKWSVDISDKEKTYFRCYGMDCIEVGANDYCSWGETKNE